MKPAAGLGFVNLASAPAAPPAPYRASTTVKADANTGLSSPDVFYFGNLIGDANGDGKVGFPDLVLLARNFGQKTAAGDFDADGKVDFTDLVISARQYGQSLPLISVAPLAAAQQNVEGALAFASQKPVTLQNLPPNPNFGPGDPTSDKQALHRFAARPQLGTASFSPQHGSTRISESSNC